METPKTIRYIFFAILFAALFMGCASNSQKSAKLRIGQFLFSQQNVKISIELNENKVFSKTLSYGDLTPYRHLKPGKYTIKVSVEGETILQSEYGIGNNGIYSLCLYGIPNKNLKKNYQTTADKLHTIFAGEEAKTSNGEMPKMRMLNDEFQKGKNEAQVLWVNLVPGVKTLTGKYQNKNKEEKSFSSSKYPKAVNNKALQPGNYKFWWNYKGSPHTLSTVNQKIEAKKHYTFFVLGKLEDNSKNLRVVTGVTNSE